MESDVNPIQMMVDGLSAKWQRDRATEQMTLGSLIEALAALPSERQITGLGELDSYRGYYCDLAFEPAERIESVGELLARCRAAMGQVFTGYKGGEYTMGRDTPVWVAPYGSCGDKLVSLNTGGDPISPVVKPDQD